MSQPVAVKQEQGTGRGRGREVTPRALEARDFAAFSHILVHIADVSLRPRFAESCRAFGDLLWCSDADELAVRALAPEATGVVVDFADGSGQSTAPVVARLREARPELPIVLWCERADAADLGPLVAAGVSAVVFREETDLENRLLSSITRASDVTFRQLTDQAIHRRVPPSLAPVVRLCLDQASGIPSVDVVAKAVGLSPRALAYQLKRSGMPPVSALVMWSKALVAAYRLERSTEPIAVIAKSLGFASGSALRRLIKRCANDTPQGLRQPGGFGWVLRCFERRLGRLRRPVG